MAKRQYHFETENNPQVLRRQQSMEQYNLSPDLCQNPKCKLPLSYDHHVKKRKFCGKKCANTKNNTPQKAAKLMIKRRQSAATSNTTILIEYKSPILGLIHLDSDIQKILAMDLDRNKVRWIQPTQGFSWADKEGKTHVHIPQFYLEDFKLYIDTKKKDIANQLKEVYDFIKKFYKVDIMVITEKEHLNFNYIKEKQNLVIQDFLSRVNNTNPWADIERQVEEESKFNSLYNTYNPFSKF